jgi:hypothetical protein
MVNNSTNIITTHSLTIIWILQSNWTFMNAYNYVYVVINFCDSMWSFWVACNAIFAGFFLCRLTGTHYPDSRANSLLFLLNAACLAEKQQFPILLSLVWPDRGSNPWSTTLEASTLNDSTWMYNLQPNLVFWIVMMFKMFTYKFMIQFYSYLYFCQSYSWNKDYLINYSQ